MVIGGNTFLEGMDSLKSLRTMTWLDLEVTNQLDPIKKTKQEQTRKIPLLPLSDHAGPPLSYKATNSAVARDPL